MVSLWALEATLRRLDYLIAGARFTQALEERMRALKGGIRSRPTT
jgi:hypothetical protein